MQDETAKETKTMQSLVEGKRGDGAIKAEQKEKSWKL